MSRSLYARILLPVKGYEPGQVYDDVDINLTRIGYFMENSPYFAKLQVRTFYPSIDDIKKFIEEKYGLPKIGDCCMSYGSGEGRTLSVKGQNYPVSAQEVDSLRTAHISEEYYCNVDSEFHIDVHLSSILDELIPEDFALVNDVLFSKAAALVTKDIEGREESIEDYMEYFAVDPGKLLVGILMAKEMAKEVGGIAVLEYM